MSFRADQFSYRGCRRLYIAGDCASCRFRWYPCGGSCGPRHIQSRHRADCLSFLFDLSSAGRGGSVFAADLFGGQETCATNRRGNALACNASVAAGAATAEVRRRTSTAASEINVIQSWVEQGEVEGDPADLPPQPKFVEGWRLGKPDLILTATKPLDSAAPRNRYLLELHLSGSD